MLSLVSIFAAVEPTNLPSASFESSLASVLRVTFAAIALLSVVFIAIGGLKYTLAGGDPGGLAKAKNTILYAIVGLIIGISAFTIVGFISGRL